MQHPHEKTLPAWLEDAWLDRYLDRDLTESEEAWFEAYALDKPRLIAGIENDTALRDGLHAWHAGQRQLDVESDAETLQAEGDAIELAARARSSRSSSPSFRPFAIAASLALAGLLGASAARWIVPGDGGDFAIASPNRIVFDTMRGGDSAPSIDPSSDSSAPLLLDIAVPVQATDVVAHFADQSTLALPVSADGFVSLTGARSALLGRSPIRIAWQLGGQAQERMIDLATTLANQKGAPSNG